MDQEKPNAVDLMIDDLAKRVAQISVESSNWRARAILAEQTLEELKAANEQE